MIVMGFFVFVLEKRGYMAKYIKNYLLLLQLIYCLTRINAFYDQNKDNIEILDHESIKTILNSDRFTWVEVINNNTNNNSCYYNN